MRDYLAPVLRESKFKEHGRITPDEFVAAGDFLTYKFPTWAWANTSAAGAADASNNGEPSSSGEAAAAPGGVKIRDFLPRDKQYLISRGVPCLRRVSQMEQRAGSGSGASASASTTKAGAASAAGAAEPGTFLEAGQLGDKDDDWLGTHDDGLEQQSAGPSRASARHASSSSGTVAPGDGIAEIPDDEEDEDEQRAPQLSAQEEQDLADRVLGGFSLSKNSSAAASGGQDDIGDIPDIPDEDDDEDGAGGGGGAATGNTTFATAAEDDDDDELGGMGAGVDEAEDPATALRSADQNKPLPPPPPPSGSSGGAASGRESSSAKANLLSVRTYDCLITYDKYYQTPRMWLVGYDEHGSLLTPAQIFEDVSSDYASKTVTIEPFPHSTTMSTASIHPCKHASVMRKVIERMNVGVVEAQRKAAAAAAAAAKADDSSGAQIGEGAAAAGGEEKKKKSGWSLPGAVKKVTGKSSSSSAADASDAASGAQPGQGGETVVEGLRVDQYLLIFLKFMASIVPAIEIDATQAM